MTLSPQPVKPKSNSKPTKKTVSSNVFGTRLLEQVFLPPNLVRKYYIRLGDKLPFVLWALLFPLTLTIYIVSLILSVLWIAVVHIILVVLMTGLVVRKTVNLFFGRSVHNPSPKKPANKSSKENTPCPPTNSC